MVADLMDEHMGDDISQRLLVLGPVVENGAAVERYAVGPFARRRVPPFGDAAPLKQAQQVEGRLERKIVHDLVSGKFRNLDDDLAGQPAKFLRQVRIGLQCEEFELLQRGSHLVAPGAGLVDASHASSFDPRHIGFCADNSKSRRKKSQPPETNSSAGCRKGGFTAAGKTAPRLPASAPRRSSQICATSKE